MSASSPWLTTAGASAYANVSLTTIMRAINRGDLRATRLNRGRIYRIHKTWVDEFLGLNAPPEKEAVTGS